MLYFYQTNTVQQNSYATGFRLDSLSVAVYKCQTRDAVPLSGGLYPTIAMTLLSFVSWPMVFTNKLLTANATSKTFGKPLFLSQPVTFTALVATFAVCKITYMLIGDSY